MTETGARNIFYRPDPASDATSTFDIASASTGTTFTSTTDFKWSNTTATTLTVLTAGFVAANAAEFIDRIGRLTRDQAAKEYEVYLKRKREDDPKAAAVDRWEARYYEQLVRKRDFDYDAQEARPYFPFEGVKRGILDVTSKLFGVTYTRIENAAVWHPSVEAYEVREGDPLLGRFFLDLHPRPGKYNHAAQFNVRTGVTGTQLPEAALVCNFAGGTPGDPGLMEHDDVLTFFHEFGHLLHTIFGGHQRWMPVSGREPGPQSAGRVASSGGSGACAGDAGERDACPPRNRHADAVRPDLSRHVAREQGCSQ